MKSSGKEYVTICVTTTDRRVHDTYILAHACGQSLGILVTLGSPAWSWEQEWEGDFATLSELFVVLFCFVWGFGHFQVLFFIVKYIKIARDISLPTLL